MLAVVIVLLLNDFLVSISFCLLYAVNTHVFVWKFFYALYICIFIHMSLTQANGKVRIHFSVTKSVSFVWHTTPRHDTVQVQWEVLSDSITSVHTSLLEDVR